MLSMHHLTKEVMSTLLLDMVLLIHITIIIIILLLYDEKKTLHEGAGARIQGIQV